MMGSTHIRVGVLYYVILSVTVIPIIAAIPLLYGIHRISIVGIMVAALAAMLPDMDSQHSMINQINPVTGVANQIIGTVTKGLELAVKLAFTIGIAILIIRYAPQIISKLNHFSFIKPYSKLITYGAAAILFVAGLLGGGTVAAIPILGDGYKSLISAVNSAGNFIKRFVMVIVYVGAGILIMVYNYKHGNDTVLYLTGALIIAAAIFPHRTFLHSAEGLALFSYCAFYFFHKAGVSYLGSAFFLGYSSHLYLSDMFTKEGVPLSIIPRILKKTGIYERLKGIQIFNTIYKVLNIRLRIPISSTGTDFGNRFEAAYVLVLLIVAAAAVLKGGLAVSSIKII